MATPPRELTKNEEIKERCQLWVKSQTESHPLSSPLCSERGATCELDDCIDTDSEFDSVSECGGIKKRRITVSSKDEVLNLLCEWKNCNFKSISLDSYTRHVALHAPHLEIKTVDDQQVYACQWKGCEYLDENAAKITRHLNYHSYHTKLKVLGANLRGKIKLPKCQRESMTTNVFDPTPMILCQWGECLKSFNNFQLFLYHVSHHLENYPRGNKVEGGVKCEWVGCKGNFSSFHKLKDHIKCHTKEKVVACPTCGAIFASNTKFFYHCRRQISIEVQGFQCSYCTKFYPTERILREHMRFHVFKYKCNKCDMSCESPASLAKHIRYRHVSSRPFHCQLCSHSTKSQQDLDSHMTVHTNGPNFFCNNEGCTYTCKNAYVLDRHIERVHRSEVRWYCCHECPIKYRKSYTLTKHLIEAHNLQWPTGHKRFQYTRDDEGCYRLQMVRYECFDEDADDSDKQIGLPDKDYKLKIDSNAEIPRLEIVEDKGEDDSNTALEVNTDVDDNIGKSMPVISNILISIDELDAYGNIIDSKVIEAQETNVLPPSDEPPIILT
ncbi:histone H4 transcription factor [Chelonus insularis]|uniref:histone H4 transcription factor n=1 Tax=Chelonus insularis TaxID=460826 RepID=UPI001588C27E|nr:histone H4 transcription factor [Chelonus insularis]XP_034943927.1 histone H4 transcription factor [Chelonus insularis]